MAKGNLPLNQFPRSGFGNIVCDQNAIGTGAVHANELDANVSVEKRSVAGATITTTAGGEVLWSAPCGGTIAGIRFCAKDALAQNDTNFVAFGVLNKTQTLTIVDSTAAANTTKSTGGAALPAYQHRLLTMNPAALAVNALDVIALSATVTGTLANGVTEGIWTITLSPS